jgi:hypothetical protein
MTLQEVRPLVGRRLFAVVDELQGFADRFGLVLNVQDPEYNPGNIDVNLNRLDVMTDAAGIITSLSLG